MRDWPAWPAAGRATSRSPAGPSAGPRRSCVTPRGSSHRRERRWHARDPRQPTPSSAGPSVPLPLMPSTVGTVDATDRSSPPPTYHREAEPLGMITDIDRRVRTPQRQEHQSRGHWLETAEQFLDLQAGAHRQRGGGAPVVLGERPHFIRWTLVAGVREDEMTAGRHHLAV